MLYKTISKSEPLRLTKNGKDILVTINKIKGSSISFGIDCPIEIDINRPDAIIQDKKLRNKNQKLKIRKNKTNIKNPIVNSNVLSTKINPNANKPILTLKKKNTI